MGGMGEVYRAVRADDEYLNQVAVRLGRELLISANAIVSTYVWPAWMRSALHAQAIARGEESTETTREIVREFDLEHDAER